MQLKHNNTHDGILKSIFTAYFILVLHICLIAGLGFLVLFFRGIVSYMLWIFLGGTAALIFIGYRMQKRMKEEGKTLAEMLSLPLFKGKSLEVSLLGGLASFRIENPETPGKINLPISGQTSLLEDPETIHVRELAELVRLLDKNLITIDEYNKAKQKIFSP